MQYLQNIATCYKDNKDNNIKVFLKKLKHKYCYLFSVIYELIWKFLNLETYSNKIMVITL